MKRKNSKIFAFLAPVGLLIIMAFFIRQQKPSCGPTFPPEPVCETPKDCEGLPHIMCAGEWECIEGSCIWECDLEEKCFSDKDCPDGYYCQPLYKCKEGMKCPNSPGKCVKKEKPECIKTGCSGEVCASEPTYTPCVYKKWFECLKFSKCGNFAPDGSCGWLQTPEYIECMKKYKEFCESDFDCPDGFYCDPETGKCKEKQKGECDDNSDCPKGFHCEKYGICIDCVPGAEDCIPGCFEEGKCVPKFGECSTDDDCPPWQYCDPCGCPPDAYCFACIPKCMDPIPCDKYGKCPKGFYCDPCLIDPKCPMCDVCYAGCLPKKCADACPMILCPPGMEMDMCTCECIPKKCKTDKDCGPGAFCDTSDCPMFSPCAPDVPDCMPPECIGECKPKLCKDKDAICPAVMCPQGQKMDPCTCKCIPAKD